jgi:predicted nucleic acid-binding protein
MPQEYNIVIADTSCFILLDKINELELLKKVFSVVTTTPEIAGEFGKELPEWIDIKSASDYHYINILEIELDKGEASAIALALESDMTLLILDDFKARKMAEKLNLNFTGTLGVILKAKESGILASIKPIIQKIQKTNFRFSEKVMREILNEANE